MGLSSLIVLLHDVITLFLGIVLKISLLDLIIFKNELWRRWNGIWCEKWRHFTSVTCCFRVIHLRAKQHYAKAKGGKELRRVWLRLTQLITRLERGKCASYDVDGMVDAYVLGSAVAFRSIVQLVHLHLIVFIDCYAFQASPLLALSSMCCCFGSLNCLIILFSGRCNGSDFLLLLPPLLIFRFCDAVASDVACDVSLTNLCFFVSALDSAQSELFDLKAKYDEATAAKWVKCFYRSFIIHPRNAQWTWILVKANHHLKLGH